MVNGTGHDGEDAVLSELREWKQRGADLRSRLESTRDRLRSQLAEVEEALADLSIAKSPKPRTDSEPARIQGNTGRGTVIDPWADNLKAQGLTATDVVLAVLAHEQRWMSSQQIFEIARRVKPDLTTELLHSALYRLVQSQRIASKGTKGSKLYATLDLAEEIAVS